MSEWFLKVLVSIKLIRELLNRQQLQRQRHHHRPQKMISRDGAGDRPQFQHRVLNHHLRADQFHLALFLARFSDHS